MSINLLSEKEEIKCSKIINRCKNDQLWWCYEIKNVKENKKNWPEIPDHSYRILITGWSGSRKKIHYLI